MSLRPGLTVVVLTYNAADTIESCLQGLVDQVDQDFDVLIVDDDSEDDTAALASQFRSRLRLTVIRNGSHCIPRGRNLGLDAARTAHVAFVDSDDSPTRTWTRVIREAFDASPDAALLSGNRLPAFRTRVAQAIALNDDLIRRVAGSGVTQFSAGNCAINRAVWPQARFDESFRAAEDLELVSRVRGQYRWVHLPGMLIHHYSRDTLSDYARQMYAYGRMKHRFAFAFGSYRPVDYGPLGLFVVGAGAAAVTHRWWAILLLLAFCLLESFVVVVLRRPSPVVAALTLPAWLVKNLAWSCGIVRGGLDLLGDRGLRSQLRVKRSAPTHG
jgi:glycosyltransferase involved in cell wall biosynthesis